MSDIIVSVSGIRGIIGDNLTPENILKFTSAFAAYCRKKSKSKKIVVGRDGRQHGELISNSVISILTMYGFQVIDIGIVPTPTVQIATEETKSAGGIAITASHNPQIWNGLKFLNSDGTFLDGEQIKEILNIDRNIKFAEIKNIKPVIIDNSWIEKHIEKALKKINIGSIRKAKFKIVVDAVNSAGSVIVPLLLKKLGCTVIELFCDETGIFPHTPEPLPHNLKLLAKTVIKNKADLGIAVDPDSDRLVLITNSGKPFSEENTIATVVNNILKNSKAKEKNIVVNLSTTRAVDNIAKLYNAKVHRSAVGEINVVKEMKRVKAIVGGEGSGGVIIPEVHYGRDAILAIPIILQEFAEFGTTIDEYKKSLPEYFITKDKIRLQGNPDILLNRILNNYANKNCTISRIDGIKLDFEDYWIHLRKSNTEPIIRIITEAKNKNEAEKNQKEFMDSLK